ncbi:MAG: hypothetical protein DRP47_10670 [Candidatus Zixiibacteriota bacterium]|nr:MAG: hypothetical protein DRP47_10670 [candidate division Zixibacteria bacterium]
MLSDSLNQYSRQKVFDHLLSLLILLLLLCLAIVILMKYQRTALSLQAIGPLQSAKLDDLYYWNIYGVWPEDTGQAMAGLDIHKSYPDDIRVKTVIEDGAIHVEFIRGELSGQKISFRPVVPKSDPFGPVHWRTGHDVDDPDYLVQGSDRTSVEASDIPYSLR